MLRVVKYGESIKEFFVQLADPSSRVATDVYSYMFLCDFFNFFVILIGYSSFGVSTYLNSQVLDRFFTILLLHVFVIPINRLFIIRCKYLFKLSSLRPFFCDFTSICFCVISSIFLLYLLIGYSSFSVSTY